jgi:hypothetical protein
VGVAVLALVAGCGESPLRGALRARERVRCEAIDRCCTGSTETVDQCVERRMTSTEILGELARDEGALRRGEARFDSAAVDACVEAVTRDLALCAAPAGRTQELACAALVVAVDGGKAGDTCGDCERGLVCVGATCRRVAQSGEDCGFLAVCAAGLTCARGVCVAGAADGAACASGSECASGSCVTAGTRSTCAPAPMVSTVVCPSMTTSMMTSPMAMAMATGAM